MDLPESGTGLSRDMPATNDRHERYHDQLVRRGDGRQRKCCRYCALDRFELHSLGMFFHLAQLSLGTNSSHTDQ